jgi:hypothetical protein
MIMYKLFEQLMVVVIGLAVVFIGLPIYFAETGEWHNLWIWAYDMGHLVLLFVVLPFAVFVLLPKVALKGLDLLAVAYDATVGRIL